MPFGAVKALLDAGTIALVATDADFQLPAYAIYKPLQAVSDPVLDCLESAILDVAASVEEAQPDAARPQPGRNRKAKHRAAPRAGRDSRN
jgi:hypothetical protein